MFAAKSQSPSVTPSREPFTRRAVSDELVAELYEILDATMLLMDSEQGNIQVYDPVRDVLEIVAHRGLPEEFVSALRTVSREDETASARALRQGKRVIIEDVMKDPDYAPYLSIAQNAGFRAVQATPMLGHDGKLLGVLATELREARQFSAQELRILDLYSRQAADSIERANVERDLDTARRRLETALKAGEIGVFDWDMQTNEVHGDENFERIFGVKLDKNGMTLQSNFEPMIHPDDRAASTARVKHSIETGEPYESEYRIVAEGTTRWVISRGKVERDAAGKPLRFLGVLLDITARKQAEETLREMDRQKNAFLAQLAHELRNPLAPIRNAARIFRMKQSAEPDVLWASEVIDRQVDHLTRLIDDLLDVSRISRNKLELRKQRLELQDIVNAAVEISRPTIDQNGHKLVLNVSAEPIYLLADMARLTQALMNLIINAAKYTDAGGSIELSAGREGDNAVMRVKDNGIGMEASAIPKLFEMFFQADASMDRSQGGLGIGLSLVKSVVELHGGTVEGRSTGLGKGSEFIARVPVLKSAVQQSASKPADAAAAAKPNTRRVLVVDDNRDGAESLAMFLQIGGHEVRTAYDGEEAIAMAETFRPEVVLLDIGMPKLNGYDACRRIRGADWGRDMVLIAQTGWGQEEDKRRAREAGFDDHVVKPVDPTALMKMVTEAKRQ